MDDFVSVSRGYGEFDNVVIVGDNLLGDKLGSLDVNLFSPVVDQKGGWCGGDRDEFARLGGGPKRDEGHEGDEDDQGFEKDDVVEAAGPGGGGGLCQAEADVDERGPTLVYEPEYWGLAEEVVASDRCRDVEFDFEVTNEEEVWMENDVDAECFDELCGGSNGSSGDDGVGSDGSDGLRVSSDGSSSSSSSSDSSNLQDESFNDDEDVDVDDGIDDDDDDDDDEVCVESSADEVYAGKPKMSYAQLIAEALLEANSERRLTLSEIYVRINARHPYFSLRAGSGSKSWQNAIRHNLTLNKAFVKVPRPPNEGRGSFWTLKPGAEDVIFKRIRRTSSGSGRGAISKRHEVLAKRMKRSAVENAVAVPKVTTTTTTAATATTRRGAGGNKGMVDVNKETMDHQDDHHHRPLNIKRRRSSDDPLKLPSPDHRLAHGPAKKQTTTTTTTTIMVPVRNLAKGNKGPSSSAWTVLPSPLLKPTSKLQQQQQSLWVTKGGGVQGTKSPTTIIYLIPKQNKK